MSYFAGCNSRRAFQLETGRMLLPGIAGKREGNSISMGNGATRECKCGHRNGGKEALISLGKWRENENFYGTGKCSSFVSHVYM